MFGWILTFYQSTKFYVSKFKAFADDNLDMAHTVQFLFHRVQSILGKGENAGLSICYVGTKLGKISEKLSICSR